MHVHGSKANWLVLVVQVLHGRVEAVHVHGVLVVVRVILVASLMHMLRLVDVRQVVLVLVASSSLALG